MEEYIENMDERGRDERALRREEEKTVRLERKTVTAAAKRRPDDEDEEETRSTCRNGPLITPPRIGGVVFDTAWTGGTNQRGRRSPHPK